MKKLLIVFLVLFLAMPTMAHSPFAGKTKHKTVKRQKKRDVRRCQNGKHMYYYKHGKIRKRI